MRLITTPEGRKAITDEMYNYLASMRQRGGRISLLTGDVRGCGNSCQAGYFHVETFVAGPDKTLPMTVIAFGKDGRQDADHTVTATWEDGSWYGRKIKTFKCPSCDLGQSSLQPASAPMGQDNRLKRPKKIDEILGF